MKRLRHASHGFTIIELLVATAVFSVILVVITAGIMLFTRDYYKGMVQANTQNVTRNIVNVIGQAIQFSPLMTTYPGWPAVQSSGAIQGYCINNVLYGYVLGEELNGSGTYNAAKVLAFDGNKTCSQSLRANLASDYEEMMGQHMRLVKFNVSLIPGTTDSYQIDVKVAYGEDDLLCSPSSVPNSCNSSGPMPGVADYTKDDLQCKGHTGSQYCAVSELNTVVKKRL